MIPAKHVGDLITQISCGARYALFLGAGASAESGVPLASSIVKELLRQSYTNHVSHADPASVPDPEIRSWAEKQQWFHADSEASEFARVMRNVLPGKATQAVYLRKLICGKRPSTGYRHLGALLGQGIFQTIVTTNFDDLVRAGCDPALSVYDIDAELWLNAGEQRPAESRLILRIHGDFVNANLLNTEPQLDVTPLGRYRAVRRLLKDHGLIVIGYGGYDVKLMREIFGQVACDPTLAGHGVYWCHLAGETPSRLAQDFASGAGDDRAFFVEIPGFDATMKQLADAFKCDLGTDLLDQYRSLSNDYALLRGTVEAWGRMSVSGPASRVEKLREIVNTLRMEDAALLVHRGAGSFAVEGPVAPGTARSALLTSAVLQRELVDRTSYKVWATRDQAGDDSLWQLFAPGHGVEAFAVWDGGTLTGVLAVASSSEKTTVYEREQYPLVSALAQLLLRAAHGSRTVSAGAA